MGLCRRKSVIICRNDRSVAKMAKNAEEDVCDVLEAVIMEDTDAIEQKIFNVGLALKDVSNEALTQIEMNPRAILCRTWMKLEPRKVRCSGDLRLVAPYCTITRAGFLLLCRIWLDQRLASIQKL